MSMSGSGSGSGLFVMCINTAYKYNEICFAQSILSLKTTFSAVERGTRIEKGERSREGGIMAVCPGGLL